MRNLFSDQGLVSILSFLFLVLSGILALGIGFSDHHIMENVVVIVLVIFFTIGNITFLVSSLRNLFVLERKILSFVGFLVGTFSAVVLLVPVFDQLGWFGF